MSRWATILLAAGLAASCAGASPAPLTPGPSSAVPTTATSDAPLAVTAGPAATPTRTVATPSASPSAPASAVPSSVAVVPSPTAAPTATAPPVPSTAPPIPATAAPTPAPTPIPTPIPTPACSRAASPSIDGWVTWGRIAVAGARVELRPSTLTGPGAPLSAATTRADGYFVLTGYDPAADQEVDLAPQLGYLAAIRPTFRAPLDSCGVAHLGDAPNSFNVQKPITGLSMPACASFDCQGSTIHASAPYAVRWDALPTATVFCVNVLNNDTAAWALIGGDCPNDPSPGAKSVGLTTSFTIPALPPGRYQFSVFSESGDVFNPTGWATAYFTVR